MVTNLGVKVNGFEADMIAKGHSRVGTALDTGIPQLSVQAGSG